MERRFNKKSGTKLFNPASEPLVDRAFLMLRRNAKFQITIKKKRGTLADSLAKKFPQNFVFKASQLAISDDKKIIVPASGVEDANFFELDVKFV